MNKKIIYAVHFDKDYRMPVGLGMVVVNTKKQLKELGIDSFDFSPGYIRTEKELWERVDEFGKGIFLISNYDWNIETNVRIVRELMAKDLCEFTIFGGPSIPLDVSEVSAFMKANSFINVVVHGEGEEIVPEILKSYIEGRTFKEISCITYNGDGNIVTTGGKASVQNLDTLLSPYLEGEFDSWLEKQIPQAVSFETSRGCPYNCAFCNWGQSTRQKMRTFPIDRIYAELEWIGRHKIPVLELTDSNFGILKHDTEIAKYICDTKKKYNYPYEICANFDKNVSDRVLEVIKMTKEAGLVSQAILSIQTLHPETLEVIGRKNLNADFYERVLVEYRNMDLPVTTEFMVGLPFCTIDTLKSDLQWNIDRNLGVYVHSTIILPNTKIASKDYMEKYNIKKAGDSKFQDSEYLKAYGLLSIRKNQVVAGNTFDESDFIEILKLVMIFHLFYGESIIKYIAYFLNQKYNIRQVDFLHKILQVDTGRFPVFDSLKKMGDSPASTIAFEGDALALWKIIKENSWKRFYSELKAFIADEYSIQENEELDEVFKLQEFLMGYSGRPVPEKLSLKYHFPQYFKDRLNGIKSKELSEYEAFELEVTDPLKVCQKEVYPEYYEPHHGHYELSSELNKMRFGIDLNEVM